MDPDNARPAKTFFPPQSVHGMLFASFLQEFSAGKYLEGEKEPSAFYTIKARMQGADPQSNL